MHFTGKGHSAGKNRKPAHTALIKYYFMKGEPPEKLLKDLWGKVGW